MSRIILAFLMFAAALAVLGCDEDDRDSDRTDLDDLRESIAELRQTVADMEFRLARLEAKRKQEADKTKADETSAAGSLTDPRESLKPTGNLRMVDFHELTEITLPTNPTKQHVIAYVRRIHEISQVQTVFSVDDPQVAMLTRVGPAHVDVLINMLGSEDAHLLEAIRRLVSEDHKQLVLQFLPIQHQLVRVVTSKGWEEEARGILISQLANRQGYLPLEWIQAVASFEDPETYDHLKAYFAFASNHAETYEVIKDLPGIELEEAVAAAWKRAQHEGRWEAKRMAAIAIDFGHVDALGYLIRLLASGQAGRAGQRTTGRRCCDASSSAAAISNSPRGSRKTPTG